jgi:uncharacterized cupredoxin-like copper-binding protein
MRSTLVPLTAAALLAIAATTAHGDVHAARKTTLHTNADPTGDFAFTKTKLGAKPGKVTIKMKNPKGQFSEHGIAISGNGVKKKGSIANPGSTAKVTAKLKPGTYTFYCPVDGHRAAGMKGKLTIKK